MACTKSRITHVRVEIVKTLQLHKNKYKHEREEVRILLN